MPAYVRVHHGPFRGISAPKVRRWADRMLASLRLQRAELSLLLTNDAEVRELNHVFRHIDRPTDVLAFAMREGEDNPPGSAGSEILGDVIVSVDTARRQAAGHKKTLDAELRMLVAHGLLHLLGYDHQTDEDERRMTTLTRELCRAAEPTSRRTTVRAAKGVKPRGAPKSRPVRS